MPALKELAFRFDPATHTYTELESGVVLPHITGLLMSAGLIDDRWYTEESSVRGTAVHDMTATYDLGALDPSTLVSRYKGYVLAHVDAMMALKPTMLSVEEPDAHPGYRFAGRPDRVLLWRKLRGVYEVKTGGPEKSHMIQTALQAILDSHRSGLPPHRYHRMAGYYQSSGRYKINTHDNQGDIAKAVGILKEFCR